MSVTTTSGNQIVGTYRTLPIILAGLVLGVLMGGTGYTAIVTLSGRMPEKGTDRYLAPENGIGFAICAVGCAIVFAYCVLAFAFDQITIDGDQVMWRDKFGRLRVQCTSRDIVPLSFSSKQMVTPQGGSPYSFYSVMTRMGPIRFDSNMSHSGSISDQLERMSNGLHGPQHPPEQAAAWTGDPLNDSNPEDTPLR